jgi:hypothetical protein
MQGRIMGVGGPEADRPVGAPPASARSARAKSAGGPGALERAPSPAGGENFEILDASIAQMAYNVRRDSK